MNLLGTEKDYENDKKYINTNLQFKRPRVEEDISVPSASVSHAFPAQAVPGDTQMRNSKRRH